MSKSHKPGTQIQAEIFPDLKLYMFYYIYQEISDR